MWWTQELSPVVRQVAGGDPAHGPACPSPRPADILAGQMAIRIQGAGEHNLRDVDVEFGDGLTVVTGVSGSGKTSLVFDTLYHEARRRFLEIYALGSTGLKLSPAKVQAITGLGPAIAIGQNLLNRNPISTLATASGL